MTDDICRGLSADEELAICLYLDCKDRSFLDEIVSRGKASDDMISFIDNLNTGKIKRDPRKKPSSDLKAIAIYIEVVRLMSGSNRLPLKSNHKVDGAACIAGKKFYVCEEAAIKAYKKVNRAMKEAINEAFFDE